MSYIYLVSYFVCRMLCFGMHFLNIYKLMNEKPIWKTKHFHLFLTSFRFLFGLTLKSRCLQSVNTFHFSLLFGYLKQNLLHFLFFVFFSNLLTGWNTTGFLWRSWPRIDLTISQFCPIHSLKIGCNARLLISIASFYSDYTNANQIQK